MTILAKLDKEARDALPEDQFAVPGKRKLPINDERHVRLAWDMVERTQGLTDEERSTARHRILQRAKDLGIDTTDWNKVQAMQIEAMALNISNTDHPNKMPFSGILTRIDEPSDEPPGGSGARRVIVTKAAAEAAISSLLGMGVDFTPNYDGHDAQAKIGLITSATIEGNAIAIEGFIYAADFPAVAAQIRAMKNLLGFSFEAQSITVADASADPLVITGCVFTGAAILRKDKAAYRSTSLAASAAEKKEIDMTPEELKALLGEALKPVTDRLDKLEASKDQKIEASAKVRDMVEPHAAALDSCADAMEAAGIGAHPRYGHVAAVRKIAATMRAAAALGQVPAIHRDHDWPMNASADAAPMGDDKIKAALADALKPVTDKLAATETKLADLKAAAFNKADAPERKTIAPAIKTLLAKAGLGEDEGKDLTVNKLEDLMAKARITSPEDRIALKRAAGF